MGDEKSGNCEVIQPEELKLKLPITLANGVISDTISVWNILNASIAGDYDSVLNLITLCPELSFAQYNYAPPIQFAVREGHIKIVNLLLEKGAFDPGYRSY